MMKKPISSVLALVLMLVSLLSGGALAEQAAFAGGSGTLDDPWRVATAEQFDAIRSQPDGHYALTSDIDLGGFENFEPIGRFEPLSDAPEDEETPKTELTFTGTLDGQGHKISNLSISRPDAAAVGLFAVVGGEGWLRNLALENVCVTGKTMTGGMIGFAQTSAALEGLHLSGANKVTAESMVGGLIGGSFADIVNSSAQADVVMTGEEAQGAGILVGGMEGGAFKGSSVKGTVTAPGKDAFSVGGLSGCAQASKEVSDCTAEATIQVGEGAALVGGLLGHAGMHDGTATVIRNCSANARITVGEGSERIGGIVGGGFYIGKYKKYFAEPGLFDVEDSRSGGSIQGGKIAGAIAGYLYGGSKIGDGCEGALTVNGQSASAAGATEKEVPVKRLR